jgi:DNA polymerase V
MILHVDANSFYASCERVFRPDLAAAPIVVLSNNDGIIVALNREAKQQGFRRGDVYFQVKGDLAKKGVAVFSSNYTLYADISHRLNTIYRRFAPEVEVYSIDESFLFFPDWKNSGYEEIGLDIRQAAEMETGIPVSVGIAPTKTLAKVCNKLAKAGSGVCDWAKVNQDEALRCLPVGEVWGVGRGKRQFLEQSGVTTAFALARYPLDKAKRYLSVTGMRTVRELNGIPAIGRVVRDGRKEIMYSRSFSGEVRHLEEIIPPLADYVLEAVKRLREDGSRARFVTVYLTTHYWKTADRYSNYATAELPSPTSFLPEINKKAVEALKVIYREGYRYKKVMVILTGLEKEWGSQQELFDDFQANQKKRQLMRAFDALWGMYGRGVLRTCSGGQALAPRRQDSGLRTTPRQGRFLPWEMKREFLSPNYTTCRKDVPKVH